MPSLCSYEQLWPILVYFFLINLSAKGWRASHSIKSIFYDVFKSQATRRTHTSILSLREPRGVQPGACERLGRQRHG